MVVEFSCGTLHVRAAEGDRWALSGSGPSERQPIVRAATTRVDVRDPEDVGFSMVAAGSRWQVTVPRSPLVDLSVTLNAGDGTVDLSGAKIGQFDLTVNAGSLDADLSNVVSVGGTSVTLNAGTAHLGLPGTVAAANLTLNAGNLTVCGASGSPWRLRGPRSGDPGGRPRPRWSLVPRPTLPSVNRRRAARSGDPHPHRRSAGRRRPAQEFGWPFLRASLILRYMAPAGEGSIRARARSAS